MPSWLSKNRDDIRFVVWVFVGLVLIISGVVVNNPALIALGAGALGLPGYSNSTSGGRNGDSPSKEKTTANS